MIPDSAFPFPEPDLLPSRPELPDALAMKDGTAVRTTADWERRRAEIIPMLLYYEYGRLPPPAAVSAAVVSSEEIDGGTQENVRLTVTAENGGAADFGLSLQIPPAIAGPLPVILRGDLGWGPSPIPGEVTRRGYMLAEFDRTALAADSADRSTGIYPLFPDCDCGALAVWAWGCHRAIDYLLTRADVDSRRLTITGHSRGGKAALLAGALDTRIALTAPHQSGTGGAAPYRMGRKESESLADIVTRFPFWFHPRLREFAGREDRLPFDQHFLMALVAPRALLVTNGREDRWGNPAGTYQTYLAAKPVFDLLGRGDRIAIRDRDGGHEYNADDWRTLLDFADTL
jgi:hypothetical protein